MAKLTKGDTVVTPQLHITGSYDRFTPRGHRVIHKAPNGKKYTIITKRRPIKVNR